MFHQTDRPSPPSPLRLGVLVLHLFFTHSCRGQSQMIGSPHPIVAKVGDDVILPCHLEPAADVSAELLEWKRHDLKPEFVFVLRSGQDLHNVKNPSYRGRTSVFMNELKYGNVSLKLSKVQPSDQGTYECYLPLLRKRSSVKFVVEDFFKVQSRSSYIIIGLTVSLVVCILVILFFLVKWRQNKKKTKRSHMDETDTGENKKNYESEDEREGEQLTTDETLQMKQLQEEQQRREEAEKRVKNLKKELETKKKEIGRLDAEVKRLKEEKKRSEDKLQKQVDDLNADVKRLEEEKKKSEDDLQKQLLEERNKREKGEKEAEKLKMDASKTKGWFW